MGNFLFLVPCSLFLVYWHVRSREWSATGQRVVSVQGWEVGVALGYALATPYCPPPCLLDDWMRARRMTGLLAAQSHPVAVTCRGFDLPESCISRELFVRTNRGYPGRE